MASAFLAYSMTAVSHSVLHYFILHIIDDHTHYFQRFVQILSTKPNGWAESWKTACISSAHEDLLVSTICPMDSTSVVVNTMPTTIIATVIFISFTAFVFFSQQSRIFSIGTVRMYPGTSSPLQCFAKDQCLWVDTPNCVYSYRYKQKVCCSTFNCWIVNKLFN